MLADYYQLHQKKEKHSGYAKDNELLICSYNTQPNNCVCVCIRWSNTHTHTHTHLSLTWFLHRALIQTRCFFPLYIVASVDYTPHGGGGYTGQNAREHPSFFPPTWLLFLTIPQDDCDPIQPTIDELNISIGSM